MNFLDKRVKNQNAYLTAKHYQSLEIPKNRNKYFENVLLLISLTIVYLDSAREDRRTW